MFGFGIIEFIIVLVILVILFGASRLPGIGTGIGEAIKNFKKSFSGPSGIDDVPKNKPQKKERDNGNNPD